MRPFLLLGLLLGISAARRGLMSARSQVETAFSGVERDSPIRGATHTLSSMVSTPLPRRNTRALLKRITRHGSEARVDHPGA